MLRSRLYGTIPPSKYDMRNGGFPLILQQFPPFSHASYKVEVAESYSNF